MRHLVRFALLVLLAMSIARPAELSGQNQVEAVPLSVGDAEGFLGEWGLEIDADGQIFNMDLRILDDRGSVAAEVSSEFGSSKVTRIEREGDNLVLGYSADMNGESFPVVITLSPTEQGVDLALDFDRGTFVASGKGTRK